VLVDSYDEWTLIMTEENNISEKDQRQGDSSSSEQASNGAGHPEQDTVKRSKRRGRRLSFPSFYHGSADTRVHPHFEDSFDRVRMPRNPPWSIAWSDLMMTMFILFTVMYAYKSADKEFLTGEGLGSDIGTEIGTGVIGDKGGGSIGPAPDSGSELLLTKVYHLGRQTLDQEELNEFATVALAPDKTVRIILQSDLLFDLGKADIKPVGRKSLDKIISILQQTPYMINVVGHTDNLPINTELFSSNWELSLKRASEVARFIMNQSSLPEERFYITGHASYQPLRPNDTPENRAINRRVELIITRNKPQNRVEQNVGSE
jgi:chemotaxis protein MotB